MADAIRLEEFKGNVVAPVDLLSLQPGRVTGLIGHPGFGLTRLGLTMLASREQLGTVAYLDVRGWLSPPAAWEAGVSPERLVVVRCDDPVRWARVASHLLEGVSAVYAEIPTRIKPAQLHKLTALARNRKTPLVLRPLQGDLPNGMAHLRLEARRVIWEGTDRGHGRLQHRKLVFAASGKAMRGMTRLIEVEDDGTNAMRLVPGLAVASSGRATG
ncbi:MAG: hypothetical protein QNJ81_09725 [Acidimicrobiia bacterium]|nr:hypothetical protein [Acidimicrobiia bacterium]